MWFDYGFIEAGDSQRGQSVEALGDTERVNVFVMSEHTPEEFDTDFAANSATTLYPIFV